MRGRKWIQCREKPFIRNLIPEVNENLEIQLSSFSDQRQKIDVTQVLPKVRYSYTTFGTWVSICARASKLGRFGLICPSLVLVCPVASQGLGSALVLEGIMFIWGEAEFTTARHFQVGEAELEAMVLSLTFDHSPGGGQGPPVIMEGIESGDVSQMSDSSSAELLRELDEKRKIIRLGPIVVILSSLVVLAMVMFKLLPVLTLVVAGSLGALIYASFRRDILVKTVVLFYDFDPQVEAAYDALHSAASTLADCIGTWHVSASGKVYDSKYHAGASDLVSRSDTRIRKAAPPFLKTNIETVAIDVGDRLSTYFQIAFLFTTRAELARWGMLN